SSAKANFSCSVPTRNFSRGFSPAASHATSSSRVSIGFISSWSRAISSNGPSRLGARPLHGLRESAIARTLQLGIWLHAGHAGAMLHPLRCRLGAHDWQGFGPLRTPNRLDSSALADSTKEQRSKRAG